MKPVRGLDRDAYENFESFCRQDYPEYEVLLCVSEADDPVVPAIERLQKNYPKRAIHLLIGAPQIGASNKVNKLCRLAEEATYDLFVISDSDVRVDPDYLRDVAAPFADRNIGAVTVFFGSETAGGLGATLDATGSAPEFAASALLAQKLEGIHFTLGATMATTRRCLEEIGGLEQLANRYVDDFELGNRIAALGNRIELARTPVWMIYSRETLSEFLRHEMRWTIGLRNVRPGAHALLAFTFGLPWTILVATVAPTMQVGTLYLLAYLVLRYAVYLTIGVWGLQDEVMRRMWWLAPLRNAANFSVWVASFFSNHICWRGLKFRVKKDRLTPVATEAKAYAPAECQPAFMLPRIAMWPNERNDARISRSG